MNISFLKSITCSPGITGENIRVYPNPASDRITIEFSRIPDEAAIVVYTILGQVVKSRQLYDQRTQIDLPYGHGATPCV